MLGDTVGGYKLTQALERHRWGDRFVAEPTAGGAPVELLLVDANACGDRARVDRCVADARAATAIGQTAIAAILEAGVHGDGRAFLATRRLGGESLAARVRRAGRLSATQIAIVGRQVATALAAAHGKGLAHRDLSPDDIEIVAAPELPNGERVVVHGFGLAQLGGHRAPAYVAPEQWDDSAAADARSDQYALGCIAFEMACGQPPFAGTIDEVRARHLSAPAPLARSIQPDVPGALEHLLGKLLQKRPEDRPPSIGDLVRTFEVLGGGALATGPLAPTGMGEALPAPSYGAPAGFAPARSAQASSVQVSQSLIRAPSQPAAAPAPARASAPIDDTPRYSEPARKRGMPVGLVAFFVVVVAAVIAAVVVYATH